MFIGYSIMKIKIEHGLLQWLSVGYQFLNSRSKQVLSNLMRTTRECVHLVTRGRFRTCDKDGGHTIRSAIAENPMLHANFMALCFIEPKLLSTMQVLYIVGIRIFNFQKLTNAKITKHKNQTDRRERERERQTDTHAEVRFNY